MKRLIFPFSCLLLFTAACQQNAAENDSLTDEGTTPITVSDRNTENDTNSNYGYVRRQRNDGENQEQRQEGVPYLDREALADSISRMASSLPNVEDTATLVTDKEVLISYKTSAQDRSATADSVKRTALSVVPRYYHVYVSDNEKHLDLIERLSNGNSATASDEFRDTLNKTIEKMKTSPQGKEVNNNENANGE